MTLAEALARGRAVLAEAGVEGAARDARLLLAAATGLDAVSLIAHDVDTLQEWPEEQFESFLNRRADGEPVGRILGETEFFGLTFALGPGTLEPRPDTETLVEAALDVASPMSPTLSIADLGTGSGAIVVVLLSRLLEARAVATDMSEAALEVARANAARHGVSDRVRFERVDFAAGPDGPFDIVVSNPPYIRSGDIAGLQREVRDHDPRAALDGGADGLDAYRAILKRAGNLLAPGGSILFEVGYDQAESIVALCREAGLINAGIRRDLAGRERVVQASATFHGINAEAAKKPLGKVP